MKNNINLGMLLQQGIDAGTVEKMFLELDKQLKYIHSRNFCVGEINYSTIVENEQGMITFLEIIRIDDLQSKNEIINRNLGDLVKTVLGAYVYILSRETGLSIPLNYTNYVEITKKDPNYIRDNYENIKGALPNNNSEAFFNSLIFDNKMEYYSDYLNKLNLNNISGKETSRKLVKTTVAGQYMGNETDEKIAAFISNMTYPILAMCFIIITLMVGIIYYTIGG